ncbi:MAG: hypothetical protein GY950_12765 [bacterium]|nr:hypothetical protein [bacterium]
METQEKIRLIIELMNIPDFEQIISAKLLELEAVLKPKILHFRQLKERFRQMAGSGMTMLEKEEDDSPGQAAEPAYYFELKRSLKRKRNDSADSASWWEQKWEIWEIHPQPVSRLPETILKELAQAMGGYDTDSERIEYRETLSEIPQRYFDISFTKYSDTYAFGVLRPSTRKAEQSLQPDTGNMVKLNLGYRNFKKEDSYSELLRYLEAYPEVSDRLLAYFYMVEKPRIDKHLVNTG